jgi:hypothetical protein
MDREIKTIRLMINLYCRERHGGEATCVTCRELADYAARRIEKCPSGSDKPACSDCTIHCFQPERRAKIREVMRYAAPRMSFRHPLLALDHLLKKVRNRWRLN